MRDNFRVAELPMKAAVLAGSRAIFQVGYGKMENC